MSALRMKNTSERYLRSCEVINSVKQLQIKPRKSPERSWVRISLESQNFVWALFVTAKVTS